MENISKIKTSCKKHKEINAISYCRECDINMCNKCQNLHKELFDNHHLFNLDKNVDEIFTGFCNDKNHHQEFKYFCKNHNKLCCVSCLCKIIDDENGYHHNCEVCLVKDIEEEKRNKLKENMKWLCDVSANLEQSLNQMKSFSEKINEKKEKIKLNIQNVFTKIRNELNNREDELLSKIDKEYEKRFFNENLLKQIDKLPNKIKSSLERGKILEKEWEKYNLVSSINDCINIENNIKDINLLNEDLKKCEENENINVEFNIEDEEIQNILQTIKALGNEDERSFKWKFQEGLNYTLDKNGLIATKTGGGDGWNCTIIGNKEIPKNKISSWKIRLSNFYIKNNTWNVLIGIGPKNLKNEQYFYKYCWSFICGNSALSVKSGSETNYNNHRGKLKLGDIIEVIVDRKKGDLSFAVNGVNYGLNNIKIPENDELFPVVLINDQGQTVEII